MVSNLHPLINLFYCYDGETPQLVLFLTQQAGKKHNKREKNSNSTPYEVRTGNEWQSS